MSLSNDEMHSATPSVVLRNIVMEYPVKSTEKRFGWDKVRALNDISLVAYSTLR